MIDSKEYLETLEAQLAAKLDKLTSIGRVRVRSSGMDYYVPNSVQQRAHKSLARTILLCGANRIGKCVTFKTLIDTPNGEISIGELYEKGKPFDVYAWDGKNKVVAKASAPFRKPKLHKCYRFEMSDGRWIEVADKHRILTESGHWIYVDELVSLISHSFSFSTQEKNTLVFSHSLKVSSFPLDSTLDSDQLTHVSSSLSYEKKEQGYQDGYSVDFRPYDGLPHVAEGNVRAFSPLQDDVQPQSENLFCLDDQENRYSDSLQQCGCRLSIQDDLPLNEAQSFGCGCQTYDTTCLLSDV